MIRCVDGYALEGVTWGRKATKAGMVLGYVDGPATYPQLEVLYRATNVLVASITQSDTNLDALVIDCEAGDATFIEAVDWALAKIKRGERPTIYGGADNLDLVWTRIQRAKYAPGLASYWLAHYVQVSPPLKKLVFPHHLPRGRQAWQFADTLATPEGHGFDVSVVKSSWPKSVGLVKKPATRAIEVRW